MATKKKQGLGASISAESRFKEEYDEDLQKIKDEFKVQLAKLQEELEQKREAKRKDFAKREAEYEKARNEFIKNCGDILLEAVALLPAESIKDMLTEENIKILDKTGKYSAIFEPMYKAVKECAKEIRESKIGVSESKEAESDGALDKESVDRAVGVTAEKKEENPILKAWGNN